METPSLLELTLPPLNLQTVTLIAIFIISAILLSIIGGAIARRMVSLSQFAPKHKRPSNERTRTLKALLTSGISLLAFILAFTAVLSLFIPASTLIWIFGLFSAAFGFGAKPLVSDLLAGMGFIFNVTFDVGEKVEFILPMENIQGVVEEINLITTLVRSSSGELFSLPNGEIRIVRNFSRGKFSNAKISLFVSPKDVGRAIEILKVLGNEVFSEMDNLIEPYHTVGTDNLSGTKVEIIVAAKAAYGQAGDLRLQLMDRIQNKLNAEGIELVG